MQATRIPISALLPNAVTYGIRTWATLARASAVRRRHPGGQTRVTTESRRPQFPEQPRVDAVLLHLDVQGFVVGSEEPRRLALVPTGGLEDAADRVLLGVRRGRVCGLLRSEEHTSELQSQSNLVCRLLLEKKKKYTAHNSSTRLNSRHRQRSNTALR